MATERAEFNFTVKESADGTPSIAAEPMEGYVREEMNRAFVQRRTRKIGWQGKTDNGETRTAQSSPLLRLGRNRHGSANEVVRYNLQRGGDGTPARQRYEGEADPGHPGRSVGRLHLRRCWRRP